MNHSIALVNEDKYHTGAGVLEALMAKHGKCLCIWYRPERDMCRALCEIRLEKIVEMRREQVTAGPRDSYTVKYLLITVDE